MKYKIVVMDLDGTLLNTDGVITQHTQSTLMKMQQMGVQIALASGRPSYGLMPAAKKLELRNYGGYLLSYNGCQIIDAQSGEVLFEKRINPEMLTYIEKKAKKNGFSLFVYNDDTIITDSPDNPHIQYEAEINGLKIVEQQDLAITIDFAPCKCMLVSDDVQALDALEAHWRKRLNGTLDVMRSAPYFLEVVPCGVSKANAVTLLLQHLDLQADEVIAFGDGVCDVDMLQSAGMGVAMGNAPDSVKRCADLVTGTNDEDGVAQTIIEKVISNIRPAEISLDQLNKRSEHALMGALGIQYTYASEERVEATMPVDERTRQPYGILHGGATLALAETVAGMGSMMLTKPDQMVVGTQISGNHISSAHEGDTVRAVGTIIHRGRTTHVWNVDVFTSTGKLVSSVRVVNVLIKR